MSVTEQRLAAEARVSQRADELAARLDLYADGNFVMDSIFGPVVECETHWDACLVILAYGREK